MMLTLKSVHPLPAFCSQSARNVMETECNWACGWFWYYAIIAVDAPSWISMNPPPWRDNPLHNVWLATAKVCVKIGLLGYHPQFGIVQIWTITDSDSLWYHRKLISGVRESSVALCGWLRTDLVKQLRFRVWTNYMSALNFFSLLISDDFCEFRENAVRYRLPLPVP